VEDFDAAVFQIVQGGNNQNSSSISKVSQGAAALINPLSRLDGISASHIVDKLLPSDFGPVCPAAQFAGTDILLNILNHYIQMLTANI
jgi:hypothetical protein